MQMGLGTLQISPKEFWDMSFTEFYSAIQGFKSFHAVESQEPMTRSDLHNLMDMYPD